jgi:hypothetical protein
MNLTNRQKEEQWRIQQEILARRKNKPAMKKYFLEKEKKREEEAKEYRKSFRWQKDQSADVLEDWKKTKAEGKIKPLGYEDEPKKSDSLFGFNIVIPVNPIGRPEMDNGERFDLRLPYAERGYEDPDADVMGKLWSGISGLFSGKKNKKETK